MQISIMMIFLGFIIAFLIILVTALCHYFKESYQYFALQGISYLRPQILFGNLIRQILGLESIGISLQKMHNEMTDKGWKYGGYFTFCVAMVLITHLDLVKKVLQEDFEYFADVSASTHEDDLLYSQLTNLSGVEWDSMQSKVKKVFTNGNIRNNLECIVQSPGVSGVLSERINLAIKNKDPIDIKDVLASFMTNALASCVFGVVCNYPEGKSPFKYYEKKATKTTKIQRLMRTLIQIFPRLGKYFFLKSSSAKADAFF